MDEGVGQFTDIIRRHNAALKETGDPLGAMGFPIGTSGNRRLRNAMVPMCLAP
jgi:hypothetical protein